MSFINLSAELQIEIFSYLFNKDLKNVRAVSTCCRDNASVWLFHTIIACARYTPMGAFQDISSHSAYQKYVKEIVFDGTEYDQQLATDERLYNRAVKEIGDLKNATPWHRHKRFKKYQERYKEQETIKNDGVLLQTISKALERMPNVHSVVYTSFPCNIPLERKDLQDIVPRRSRAQSHPPVSFHFQIHPSPHHAHLQAGLHQLIGAVAVARYTQIREFHVEPSLDPYNYEPHSVFVFGVEAFHFAEPDHLVAGKNFFRNLTTLDMSFRICHFETQPQKFTNMCSLLSEAKGLRRLCISVLHPIPSSVPVSVGTTFGLLGLDTAWPRLTHISLQRILADERQIQALLARGGGVLKSVKFLSCMLNERTWDNVLKEVVWGTEIGEFVLFIVWEEHVDDGTCIFSGHVRTDENGERDFVSDFSFATA